MSTRKLFILGCCVLALNATYAQFDTASLSEPNDNRTNKNNPADSATVFVSFVIETTGKITHVEVYKVSCKKCSKGFKENIQSEAISVIKSMPDFEPQKERVKFIQPIKFELTEE